MGLQPKSRICVSMLTLFFVVTSCRSNTLPRAKRDLSRVESGRIRAKFSDWGSTIEFQRLNVKASSKTAFTVSTSGYEFARDRTLTTLPRRSSRVDKQFKYCTVASRNQFRKRRQGSKTSTSHLVV